MSPPGTVWHHGGYRVQPDWAKERRLSRLRSTSGKYLVLALDHGMTLGPIRGFSALNRYAAVVGHPLITGVVAHRGVVGRLPPTITAGLVLQTFGLPGVTSKTAGKVPLGRVADAHVVGADAVAVELNLNLGVEHLASAVASIAAMVADAAVTSTPILFMVSPNTAEPPREALPRALRFATELGADLIKVGLPSQPMFDDVPDVLRDAILSAPPVLLAGGADPSSFWARIDMSIALGFSGVCVGRPVMQDSSPETIINKLGERYDS